MFRKAYKIGCAFTAPVVISRKSLEGKCSSGIGSFIFVNKDGWIITAAHIVSQFKKMADEVLTANELEQKKTEIEKAELSGSQRKKQLNALPRLGRNHTVKCSAWWRGDGLELTDISMVPHADLAVGRLKGFDPKWVTSYPIFKDPDKNFDFGTSLCKLGFPFHSIAPIWHDDKGLFELPPGAFPIPFFPIDGIFTRVAEIVVEDAVGPPPFPLRWLETSSPGLRGQSGGPIFDERGAVWAVQVNTAHLPLGFDPKVPSKPTESVHQFLNVGRGVHAVTILGLLRQLHIEHNLSDY
jgi:hypothetical protein